jgi:hypothetical protein
VCTTTAIRCDPSVAFGCIAVTLEMPPDCQSHPLRGEPGTSVTGSYHIMELTPQVNSEGDQFGHPIRKSSITERCQLRKTSHLMMSNDAPRSDRRLARSQV